MGNSHIEPATKEKLIEYGEKYGHKSLSRAIDGLLAEHDLLLVTQRECELLRSLANRTTSEDGT